MLLFIFLLVAFHFMSWLLVFFFVFTSNTLTFSICCFDIVTSALLSAPTLQSIFVILKHQFYCIHSKQSQNWFPCNKQTNTPQVHACYGARAKFKEHHFTLIRIMWQMGKTGAPSDMWCFKFSMFMFLFIIRIACHMWKIGFIFPHA